MKLFTKVYYIEDWECFIPEAPKNLGHNWWPSDGMPCTDTSDGEITYACYNCGLGLWWNGAEWIWAHNGQYWISASLKPIITCEAGLMDNALE